MDPKELVKSCPLFRGIDPEDLGAMLKCMSAREIEPERGEFIMTTPGSAPLMGVVLAGEVEMISEDYFGKKSLLTVLPVGSVFGESYSCVKARNRTIAYQASGKCRVLLLDYDRILHACKLVCRFHHRMIENMVELIAEKNLELIEKLEVTSRTSIREKLLTYLTRQAERTGSATFQVPMGRTELAEYLCTDRSAMTRELSRMREEGLIDFDKRTFTLLDWKK
ncbi:MAG: Crp/Fnr family transcriptional regulator [Evtepia sp.]